MMLLLNYLFYELARSDAVTSVNFGYCCKLVGMERNFGIYWRIYYLMVNLYSMYHHRLVFVGLSVDKLTRSHYFVVGGELLCILCKNFSFFLINF